MRLDDNLNLVIPLERGRHEIYVHVAPLSREVFEAHWLVIGKTFATINAEGLSIIAGPRLAGLALKSVAQSMKVWDGPEGVERTLVAEMVRLSNVVQPGEAGWAAVPMAVALQQGTFSDREKAEVIGAIVFFTVLSAMHLKKTLVPMLKSMGDLWGTRTTSSSSTEFAASLPTLTAPGNTGGTAPGT